MTQTINNIISTTISAVYKVHSELGFGLLESVYQEALKLELRKRDLGAEREKAVCVYHRGQLVGQHFLDILVERQLVLELKTVSHFTRRHFDQVKHYLRASGLEHGLLVNFAGNSPTIKRVFV
jgi:GxxExxY protein